MSRFRSISVVLAMILVLPGLVAGGAFAGCLHAEPVAQSCCTMNGSSGEMGFHGESGAFADMAHPGQECTCSHLPQQPTDSATAATVTRVSDGGALFAAPVPVESAPSILEVSAGASNPHGPPAETRPVFLLDCALLI